MSDFYKTTRIIRDSTGDQRLAEVVKHLSSGWFPANEATINEAISEIARSNAQGSLLPILKKDLSLLGHCIKKSGELIDSTNSSLKSNPIEAIRAASREALLSVIKIPAAAISKHPQHHSTQSSISLIKQSVISCSTTEALAEKIDTDPDTAFECAFLRTLVPTLVSFNYPHLCASAIRRVRISKGSLDDELAKLVGASPARVLMSMARQWGLSPALQRTLSYEADDPRSQSPLLDRKLVKALALGESYAQATDQRIFPSAQRKWEEMKQEVLYYLGDKQLKSISEKAVEYTRPFEEVLPTVNPERTGLTNSLDDTASTFASDLHKLLRRCSPEVQQVFDEVTKFITQEGVSLNGLRRLCDGALPVLQFSGGYFFLLDSTTLRLEPILKIGSVALPRLTIPFDPTDPIAASIFSSVPIRQEFLDASGASIPFFVGSVDSPGKTGVLYMELHNDTRSDTSYDHFLEFRAFQLCFQKCIGF